ncbi:MAG: peptide deformylase [Clostridia bacterium]
MAIRNIVKMGDPILRKTSRQIEVYDDKLAELIDDLKETLNKVGGLGLASVQVGVLKRVLVVDYENQFFEVVNPRILHTEGSVDDNEGCLSVIGYRGIVNRPQKLDLEFYDRRGVLHSLHVEDYFARVFFHEIDHLDGILFPDKMIKKMPE